MLFVINTRNISIEVAIKESKSIGFLPLMSANLEIVAAPIQKPIKYKEPNSPII